MTNSGIGIVRLSGEDAFSIIDKIYKGKSPKLLSEQKSHTIHYGYIMDGEQTIDEVLVIDFIRVPMFCGMNTIWFCKIRKPLYLPRSKITSDRKSVV